MKIQVYIRTGHFNFCDPEQEDCHLHITIDNLSQNFTIDMGNESYYNSVIDDGFLAEAILEVYGEDKKKYWFDSARKDKDEFIKFVEENKKEINQTHINNRISSINEKIKSLTVEKEKLLKLLKES